VEELNDIDFSNMISQIEIANFNDDVADGINYNLEILLPVGVRTNRNFAF